MLKDDLINIQNELKCPKDQFNSFGEYKYRSCEQILEAVKPLLQANKILLTLSDEVLAVGNDAYIKATATVTKGDEELSVCAFAREIKEKKKTDSSQLTGTASSYARKYALNGLFLIDDTKDPDTNEFQKQNVDSPNKKQQPATQAKAKKDSPRDNKMSAEQCEVLKALPQAWVKQAAEALGVETLHGITFDQAAKVIHTAKIIGGANGV